MIAIDESWSAMIALDHWGKQPLDFHFTHIIQVFSIYFMVLASFLDIFGITLLNVRLLSFCFGFVALNTFFCLIYLLTKKISYLSLAMILFLAHNFCFVFFRWGRQEGLVLLFTLLTLLFLYGAMKHKKESWLFLSGVFLALSLLTHPFQAAFALSICCLLWRFPLKTKESYFGYVQEEV